MAHHALNKNEIHIWMQRLTGFNLNEAEEACFEFLSESEIKKYNSYKVDHKRIEFLVTRTMVRTILSEYLSLEPHEWQFSENEYGRPNISNPEINSALTFNLSHCTGLVVCAVGQNCELGIDVEARVDSSDLLAIAESHFSKDEYADLNSLPKNLQLRRFYEYWSLKEAYIKARGMGLSLPIQEFNYQIQGRRIQISMDKKIDSNPGEWNFGLLEPQKDIQMAYAVRGPEFTHSLSVVEHWINLLD